MAAKPIPPFWPPALTTRALAYIAGSLALAGSHGKVSTAVTNLEREGAIILGTTNLSEFSNLRSESCPDGWSALGGQCYGAYAKNHNPSGSSSGSAVGARIGLAAACLGTEVRNSPLPGLLANWMMGFRTTAQSRRPPRRPLVSGSSPRLAWSRDAGSSPSTSTKIAPAPFRRPSRTLRESFQ